MSTGTSTATGIRWRPDPAVAGATNAARLMRRAGAGDAAGLRARALDPEWLWPAIVDDLGLVFAEPWDAVLENAQDPAHARWFTGARLNLAASCVDRWAAAAPDRDAVVWEDELGRERSVTYAELRRLTDGVARALTGLGVVEGTSVGLFLPLVPETVATLMACAKLGAIAVPIFSGFAADAVATRLVDGDVRVLVTADGTSRGGRIVPMKETADRAVQDAPGVEHVLLLSHVGTAQVQPGGRDVAWERVVTLDGPAVEPLALAPDHPLLLIYTSGSTGKPKGAVLTHAGMLVTIARDAAYHADVRSGGTLCWVTDIGWIMGAWSIVAAGSLGATLCLCEGAATTPDPDRLWRLVARRGVDVLGVSPSLVRGLMVAGSEPPPGGLPGLRTLGTTGEPMNDEAWSWLLERVGGGRAPIINISGGTEVGGALLAPLPIEPLASCSLGGPALGMDVAVVDEAGEPVGPDDVGELVCRRPWPGMTHSLWRDEERFLDTYWRRWPGVWVHGDWATYDADGQWFVRGRSDDTLNVAGQRIGPSEVEGALIDTGLVTEAAAIGVPHDLKGEVIWCVAIPAVPGADLDLDALGSAVATRVGKPFRPARIVLVDALPRTRSGKILRRVVRACVLGTDPGDLSSLEDPAAIDVIRKALR